MRLLARGDCAYAIANHLPLSAAELARNVAERYQPGAHDIYGDGVALNAFEAKIATRLGKEAAVFMPSGTMAQQIALRIVADRRALRTFAGHRTNHVVLHERDGYARLHDLSFVPVGAANRSIRLDDLHAVHEPVGTLLLELPQRELGGELPSWDELVEIAGSAHSRGWHMHLDGARLWECGPAYARPYADICALFDSVYVSFYKGLGAFAGAMLAGPGPFIAEARIWLRRHGGNLFTLFPYSTIAEASFDERINAMTAYHQAAVRVADALKTYPAVTIRPHDPPTNMLHVFIRNTVRELERRAQRIAREHGVWTFNRLSPTDVPGVQRWEISCGDATLALSDHHLRLALDELFE